ncbi:hypothetical protein BU23DRAFT_464183, partial [Bimuria novae-zelandiae CBS 107.79]
NITASGGSQIFAGIQISGDSLRDRILRWLDPIDVQLVQDRLRMQHTPATGEAFLHDEFNDWLKSNCRRLWLHGEAGSGKTFLSSLLIDQMPNLLSELDQAEIRQRAIAYFYCSFQNKGTREAMSFLKSINAQLLIKHENSEKVSRSLTLVIDGLDEVRSGGPQNQFLSVLNDLAKKENPHFRVIIFSRMQAIIRNPLKTALGWKPLSRDIGQIERDIDLLALQQISQRAVLGDYQILIQHGLPEKSTFLIYSRFRLAALQIQELCDCTETHDTLDEKVIVELLNKLPRELDPFYDRIVAGIPQILQRPLESALRWLTFATRPLYVEELIEACTIKDNITGTPSTVGQQIIDITTVAERLRGMVEIQQALSLPYLELQKRTYTVQFVHQTVKEYLSPVTNFDRPAGRLRFDDAIAHKHLAQCCLAYLSYCADKQDGSSSACSFCFYSWHFWPTHFITSKHPKTPKARLDLDSVRLHNSMIHPDLYETSSSTHVQAAETAFQFE